MGNYKKKDQLLNLLASFPGYASAPKKVFKNVEHYKYVADGIAAALGSSHKKRGSPPPGGGAFYDSIQIDFSIQYKEEEIYLDSFASKIILKAPTKKGESKVSLRARRMYYLGYLLPPLEAMKTIGVAQIYLSLKKEGRKKISGY